MRLTAVQVRFCATLAGFEKIRTEFSLCSQSRINRLCETLRLGKLGLRGNLTKLDFAIKDEVGEGQEGPGVFGVFAALDALFGAVREIVREFAGTIESARFVDQRH